MFPKGTSLCPNVGRFCVFPSPGSERVQGNEEVVGQQELTFSTQLGAVVGKVCARAAQELPRNYSAFLARKRAKSFLFLLFSCIPSPEHLTGAVVLDCCIRAVV